MVHQVEKNLKEHEAQISAQDKGEAEAAIAATKSALEGQDIDAVKSANERLSQVAMRIGEAMYKAQQEAGAQKPAEGAAPGGEKVVDAEYEEVDEKKKKQ
jgi:molecular chaperone DnaK